MNPNLDELEKLAKAATPGKWKYAYSPDGDFIVVERNGEKVKLFALVKASTLDCRFIAACSPDTILALVARVQILEERLAKYESQRK